MKHTFKARIYKTGINWCVDVPLTITKQLKTIKGYIRVKGVINSFEFSKALVPLKNAPYRLFVNLNMMKGGNTSLGQIATFIIEQDDSVVTKEYTMPALLKELLQKNNLVMAFNRLTESRKRDILKYLSFVKTEETLMRNINKIITQLKCKETNVRIP